MWAAGHPCGRRRRGHDTPARAASAGRAAGWGQAPLGRARAGGVRAHRNNVVQAGAQAAAGDDRGRGVLGVVVDGLPRAWTRGKGAHGRVGRGRLRGALPRRRAASARCICASRPGTQPEGAARQPPVPPSPLPPRSPATPGTAAPARIAHGGSGVLSCSSDASIQLTLPAPPCAASASATSVWDAPADMGDAKRIEDSATRSPSKTVR